MSKKVGANITCAQCKNVFPTELYRSIWVEYPENRSLVLNDEINAVTCPRCKHHERLEFPFLCTNVKRGFALWYEPYPDPQIDKDVADYRTHTGPNSFYSTAPRIADWNDFKRKMREMEASAPQNMRPEVELSENLKTPMEGFVTQLKKETTGKSPGTLGKLFGRLFQK